MQLPLEDSLGDILRKSRQSTNTQPQDAARAANLSDADYAALEETGKPPRDVNWNAVGRLLTLNGQNLAKLANGWAPKPIEVSNWRHFRMLTSAGDGMTVNCYLIWDEATRDAALFDTGFDARPILELIDQNRLVLKHLFLTHSHGDHLAAIEPLRARHPEVNLHSNIQSAPLKQRNRPDEIISLGSLDISHRDTPGHAEDGVTYIVENWPGEAPPVAIVGDAIFCGSMGGAKQLLALAREKVRTEILSLPEGTLIASGHGPLTTVGEQKENNPWFT